ncbi:unnamed protein product [Adineta steineri]|uniref:ENTH domain-containing protein n=1 Tax=Adineta steineri TaxID=433720 RepID=A0A818KVN9_9BILA|nr:unnamed protein product [Adineta steineri]
MQQGGQSIVDRLLAAKNTIAGQPVAKVVCKATTEEMIGPKRKHLDCLLQATHEMNVSIPEVADLLIERSQSSSWVVSFKSLITIHHLMSHGNERFEAYMASHNHHLQSTTYTDRTGMGSLDMTLYLRRYATYLYEKRESYKLMGYDFCKIKRGKDDGFLRTLPSDKLLKALPILQKQLDALLNFDISPNELINGVINSCFFLLIKDLIRLYTAFNDGIINLIEQYFNMNKKQCREALDIYKKFIDSTDKVSQYLKIAETSGMERADISDIIQAPSSLVEALENHLVHIEGKKTTLASTSSTKQLTEQDMKSFPRDLSINNINDPQKHVEEDKALGQFPKKKEVSLSPPPVSPRVAKTTNGNGFGGTDFSTQHIPSNGHQSKQQELFSDDIFSLAPSSAPPVANTFPMFDNTLDTSAPQRNVFDDILQPNSSSTSTSTNNTTDTYSLFPTNQNVLPSLKPLKSGDLNSSLNQLIDNLDIKDHSKIGKDHQWTPNDGKGQQKLGVTNGTMNAPGTTWPNSTIINAPFGGTNGVMGVQSNNMWQQPPPVSTTTNPFAVSNGSSQMNFNNIGNQPIHVNTNPFAAQPLYSNNLSNQPQVNNPFDIFN